MAGKRYREKGNRKGKKGRSGETRTDVVMRRGNAVGIIVPNTIHGLYPTREIERTE